VSTRRVEQLGVGQLSKSQVSEMGRHLDAQVEALRNRSFEGGRSTFARVDVLVVKSGEPGEENMTRTRYKRRRAGLAWRA
jgi:transposase-like protein